MALADEFRQALEDGDVDRLLALSAHLGPHLPQPKTRAEGEVTMHLTSTESAVVTTPKRFYSHAWLTERGMPSHLPDRLKPAAERMYPRAVSAVGISVGFRSSFLKPAGALIQRAMSDAVADAYAEGREDPAFVRARMAEARTLETKRLFGSVALPSVR